MKLKLPWSLPPYGSMIVYLKGSKEADLLAKRSPSPQFRLCSMSMLHWFSGLKRNGKWQHGTLVITNKKPRGKDYLIVRRHGNDSFFNVDVRHPGDKYRYESLLWEAERFVERTLKRRVTYYVWLEVPADE